MASSKFNTWFKRFGVLGFLFFLIKGLVWLFVLYGLGSGIKSCGGTEGVSEDQEKYGFENLEFVAEEGIACFTGLID